MNAKYSENQALAKLAAYCSKAERAEYDVLKKLIVWEFSDEVSQKIINRLKQENFLNEKRYCRSFIRDKIKFSKWGQTKIIFELRRKRISEQIIDNELKNIEGTEFEGPLLKILETKSKSVKANNQYEKQVKLIRFALGRGYSLDQIKRCLQNMNLDYEENI